MPHALAATSVARHTLHRKSSSQEMQRLLAMGGARYSSCIFFGNVRCNSNEARK